MKRHKLLLADDSVTIQKVVNLTFADEGVEVISVDNGDTALEMFHERSPDLVMIDVNMPGLSGYDLCEYIKTNELSKHIPVILLVGSFEPFNQTRAKQAQADDYMTKPFQSIRELVSKVTGLLSKETDERENEKTDTDSGSEMDTLEFSAEDLVSVEKSNEAEFQNQTPVINHPLDDIGKYVSHPEDARQNDEAESDIYEVATGDDLQISEATPGGQEQKISQNTSEFLFDFDDTDFLELPPINKSEEVSEAEKTTQNLAEPETAPEIAEDIRAQSRTEQTSAEQLFQDEYQEEVEALENESFEDQSEEIQPIEEENLTGQFEKGESYDEPLVEEKNNTSEVISEDEMSAEEIAEAQPAAEEFARVQEPLEEFDETRTEDAQSDVEESQTSDEQSDEKEKPETISSEKVFKELDLHNFSPDVIDAIAEKVVEKLTARMKE